MSRVQLARMRRWCRQRPVTWYPRPSPAAAHGGQRGCGQSPCPEARLVVEHMGRLRGGGYDPFAKPKEAGGGEGGKRGMSDAELRIQDIELEMSRTQKNKV